MITLFKAHGLGNDYLVLASGPSITPALAARLCDRHRGPGGDGVLEPFVSPRADHGVRIWNPDGSVAEKSGNGLRIAAWWLHREGRVPAAHTLDTGFDVVSAEVQGDAVTVEMGRATVSAPRAVALGGEAVTVTPVSVGNPHAVCFVEAPFSALPWRRWGAALEVHPSFPNRTNVQFASVPGPGRLALRIWERGAGETQASGSSSCAAAAAAVASGRLSAGAVRVEMPGGSLDLTVSAALDVRMRGPVVPVCLVQIDAGWEAGWTPPAARGT